MTIAVCAHLGWGQTQVDLSNQAKQIDFATSAATRPAKTGASLPSVCKIGDMYFKVDATPAQNLYGCTATNVWTLFDGTSPSVGLTSALFQSFISDGAVSVTPAIITVNPAVFRNNNVVSAWGGGTVQANSGSLAAGAQIWLEFDPASQTLVLLSNASVTQSNLAVTNVLLGAADAAGFSQGRIPMATCYGGSTPNEWLSCTDARTPFSTQAYTAGAGVALSPADGAGRQSISVTASGNPRVYKTLVSGPASCPAGEGTLNSYQFPALAALGAGDGFDIQAWFEKTGTSTPSVTIRVDGIYANDPPNLGDVVMNSPVVAMHVRGQILSTSAIAYVFEVQRDTGTGASSGAFLGSGTLTATPLIEFRAANCAGADSVRVLGATVTLFKGASL